MKRSSAKRRSAVSRDAGSTVKGIRSRSNYPVYRTMANLVLILCYVVGGLVAVMGLILWFRPESPGVAIHPLFTSAYGLLVIVVGKYVFEASSMLADCADSLIVLCEKTDTASERELPVLEPLD